jgi:phospholipase/carboxylesterase
LGAVTAGAAPGQASVACLFLHGRGQTPDEMVRTVLDRVGLHSVHCCLPAAVGKSWYDAKAVEPLTDLTQAQVGAALDLVAAEMAALAHLGFSPERIVLAGFSQGGCVALEYALQRGGALGGLCLLTACRVGGATGSRPLPGLPVYAGCGDADSWIPLPHFTAALGDLGTAGARVRADIFPGRPHEVCDAEVAALRGMLQAVAIGEKVW